MIIKWIIEQAQINRIGLVLDLLFSTFILAKNKYTM